MVEGWFDGQFWLIFSLQQNESKPWFFTRLKIGRFDGMQLPILVIHNELLLAKDNNCLPTIYDNGFKPTILFQ